MNRQINYSIPTEYDGYKLTTFLSEKGYPAKILTALRQDCNLSLINSVPSYLNSIIHVGDIVDITIIENEENPNIVPVNLAFDILFEDEDILVVNKPSDMPIHPSINNYDNTLANAVAYKFQNETSAFVYRCINRLDRDTSGIVIIAKNPLSGAILSRAMKEREIHRVYTAVVCGNLTNKKGTINLPIGRKNDSCIERIIDMENGETAITHYEVVNNINDLSVVECTLDTGRTHQIRVHMSHLGHPLAGDYIYNPGNTLMSRQALHAGKISFTHPVTGEAMSFQSDFPSDMQALLS